MQWTVGEGGNGHWYEAVSTLNPADIITWQEANIAAQSSYYDGMQGHLATVSSLEENDWLFYNLEDPWNFSARKWLGGYQTPPENETDAAADWHWVTGEELNFTNWASGEPNNTDGPNYVEFFNTGDGKWNDHYNNSPNSSGYIIEYEAAPVPEPTTMLLLGSGLIGFAGFRRRFRK